MTKEIVLETTALIEYRRARGLLTNYTLVINHLKSEETVHPLLTIDNCPPCELSLNTFTYAIHKVTGFKWGRAHKGGMIKKKDEVKELRAKRRKLFSVLEHSSQFLRLEDAGAHIIVYRD